MRAMTPTEPREPLGAPSGEVVHTLEPSPCFGVDRLCFSARHSGLWRSDDGGATWRPALAGSEVPHPVTTTSIAFSPRFADDRTVFGGARGGVLRSRNAGASWRVVALPSPPPLVSCLVTSPAFEEDGVVVAGTLEDGVLRSADRGETWRRWNFGLLDLSVLALAVSPGFAADETLFAGTETGLFLSENGGRSWRETPFPDEAAPVLALAVSPTLGEDRVVWAGTERSGVWRSSDPVRTWERVDRGTITDPVNAIACSSDPADAHVVLATLPEAAMISRDDGRSWTTAFAGPAASGGIASVVTPSGMAPGARLLVGLRDGSVLRGILGV